MLHQPTHQNTICDTQNLVLGSLDSVDAICLASLHHNFSHSVDDNIEIVRHLNLSIIIFTLTMIWMTVLMSP